MVTGRSRTFSLLLLAVSTALATRPWSPEELAREYRTYQPHWLPRPESLVPGPRRFNYLQRIRWTCDFVARFQVSDSGSPDFGGIIEAEHMPGVIETDNTQEAIWVWSRWFELTGRDDYLTNIRRAWTYVRRYPAYREHGSNPANLWYAVWNCGLGLMAEAEYRKAYGDTSYQAYADTCRQFYLANQLNELLFLDNFVVAQSSGMAYDYALERNDPVLRDTALARGTRVKSWLEADPSYRLGFQTWAMCGGTAFWGVAHTFCQNDTLAGKAWLATYADSLPGFYPAGNWNCSHNIWLANAYRASAEIGHGTRDWLLHHYLTDTLLMKDTDLDGGIPATWTDPATQDQTWVSTYLDFMGMDPLARPVLEHDIAALEFVSPSNRGMYLLGDTIPVAVPLANVGKNDATNVWFKLLSPGYQDSILVPLLSFLETDTVRFRPFVPNAPGIYQLAAVTSAPRDSNPLNDSAHVRLRVYGRWHVTGTLADSVSGTGIPAWVKARLKGQATVWDSCATDSAGRFNLSLIDSLYTITIEPDVPYYRRSWDIPIPGDTTIVLRTQPAHLMVINNDSAEAYADYYTTTLDTLGVTWCLWPRRTGGLVPYNLLDRLRSKTIIWFSGDARTQTITAQDQDSLTAFLARGGNLLLTGQNIAEELAGTVFLESIIGCRFDSSGWSGFWVFGNRADSLGRPMTGTATAGGNGASNQTSRDILAPTTALSFLVYDSALGACAGVRRPSPSAGKLILLGFGFEAVNRPVSRPTYFDRGQFLNLMLSWLTVATSIAEQSDQPEPVQLRVWPTVLRDNVNLASAMSGPAVLLDVTGRKLAELQADRTVRTWRLTHIPAGVYFLRSEGAPPVRLVKIR